MLFVFGTKAHAASCRDDLLQPRSREAGSKPIHSGTVSICVT